MIPEGYKELPEDVRCRCLNLYRAWNGRYWCCNPGAGAEPATSVRPPRGSQQVGRTDGSIPSTGANPECHCGKDGHALNSVNCPVHGLSTAMQRAEQFYINAWKSVLWDATGDQTKVDRIIELAEINGLFDPARAALFACGKLAERFPIEIAGSEKP